jgi:muramoyltetrapeptide carboxypeptidase
MPAAATLAGKPDPDAPPGPTRVSALRPVTPKLRPGDRVALVAPASPVDDDRLALALENVRSLDLEPVLGHSARAVHGYLAGTDDERSFDINDALHDPTIRGIFALRGGYGTMRMLDRIDYAQMARDPKVLLGYSDLTTLLNAFYARSNVVTYHGPVAISAMTQPTRERMQKALFSGEFETIPVDEAAMPGTQSGVLRGGNLSLIAALCGTPYAIDFSDAIVLLEDVDEAPYRIDRLLTQLQLAGAFYGAAAFAIGDIPARDVVVERLRGYHRPVVTGVPFGHIAEPLVLPIGARALLRRERENRSRIDVLHGDGLERVEQRKEAAGVRRQHE